MNEISKISIVCSEGAETYTVGSKGIIKIILGYLTRDGNPCEYYLCKDVEGNNIVEISAHVPLVIERF